MLLGEVLLGEEPQVFGAFERVVAFGQQAAMLGLADRIDRLEHMRRDVVAVEDDLALRRRERTASSRR